ncbi:hypothetical protein C8J56DRAFT_772696 [Mycena floridula]|nr:hypothetical protein C8J56DRAFT_772696 [Mycena floridula]
MGKSKLKSVLQSQQSRLKNNQKQKANQAARLAEQRPKPKRKGVAPPRPTIPFLPTDKILLVGEGNFSFARALVQDPPAGLEYLPPGNITATCYDTEQECYEKYPDAKDIVSTLIARGVSVLFDIDATRLEKYPSLKGRRWDRINFNFPHAGKGITDQDRNILSNQALVLGFLGSAAAVLQVGSIPVQQSRSKSGNTSDDDGEDITTDAGPSSLQHTRGTVLITLRNVVPYTLWDIPKLAKNPPPPTGSHSPNPTYVVLRSFTFSRSVWKGYEHRMTKGERAHGTGKTGEKGEDRTWELYLRDGLRLPWGAKS